MTLIYYDLNLTADSRTNKNNGCLQKREYMQFIVQWLSYQNVYLSLLLFIFTYMLLFLKLNKMQYLCLY